MTTSTTPAHSTALAAAEAVASLLPALTELTPAGVQPGNEHVTAAFAGAAVAELERGDGSSHRVAVLVGTDLVQALADSPLGGLDLAAAVQPAIEAAAAVLTATARPARVTDLSLVTADLGGAFTAVPLLGDGIDAALLIADALLEPVTLTAASPAPATSQPVAAQPVAQAGSNVVTPVVPAQITPATSALFADASPATTSRGIEMLAGVDMEVTVELGRTRMAVRDLLALSPGTVLELDRAADGPADLLVNGRLIARGEVVVVDEDFGLRITEIIEDQGA